MVQFVDCDRNLRRSTQQALLQIVPTDELAEDAYRVVRDALRKSGKVGLGQITMRGGNTVRGAALRRRAVDGNAALRGRGAQGRPACSPSIEDDEADPDLLSVATQLIERKTAPFDASAFHDRYDTPCGS